MTDFARQIADTWNISPQLSELICDAFKRGDSPYYLAEYRPEVVVELSISYLWEIFDFLSGMEEIAAKKKRVLSAFTKAGKLTPALERRINSTMSPFELEDLLLPLRPNPRSRGQLAIKKGLETLADRVALQEDQGSIEEWCSPFIGTDPSLKSADDVMQGIKDVLAERFAYDDTVRSMARDFAFEDGRLEVIPKNKQDARFISYAGRQLAAADLTKEEMLALLAAEDDKSVRIKLSVQLFRITELLRHHVITNPDFSGFDFLCEIIDDSWARLLQPIVERDVKLRLSTETEKWAAARIAPDLEKKYAEDQRRGTLLLVDGANQKQFCFIVVNGHGDLLSATSEKRLPDGSVSSADRLRQFYLRHRPGTIVVCENDQASAAEAVVAKIIEGDEQLPAVTRFLPARGRDNPVESEWVKKKYDALLDIDTRKLYGAAIWFLRPLVLIPHLGLDCYEVHPLQKKISPERFLRILDRIITDAELHKGVLLRDIADSRLDRMECVTPDILKAVRATDAAEPLMAKADLLKVPGMTETAFRNLAGFVVVQNADDARDRSLVHPDHYTWLDAAGEQLAVSLDTIMNDPDMLRSLIVDDFVKKIYFEKKLFSQIQVGARSLPQSAIKSRRKIKLTEMKEGAIISGRVTNITPFGVFVNINAVCDGLIHISQLADEYVETPEQVVALHDKVDVRILTIDVKKRRISLSMKNIGKKGPKVKPSSGQLSTLAEHFKNR
ncbi:MAG: S1 RNA-binding domain-containing protein [Chitinispirillaceae bacterium]|jgi:uncharacterized protein|nr:S1 RNA-binding domain-containing protein [Chitinispirillaceae bacterium]